MFQFGAHELAEVKEVFMDTINGINQYQLYIPHCQDPELRIILQNQLRFIGNEYNFMVELLQNKGQVNSLTYKQINNQTTNIGIQGITPKEQPNLKNNDHDIANSMLGCAKSTATLRMRASLECSDLDIRTMLTQGSKNSSDQAYEIWQYMNKKAYYHVPTLPKDTSQYLLNHYTSLNYPNNDQMNQ